MYKLTLHYVKKLPVVGVLSLVNLGYSWAARTSKPAYQKNLVRVFRVFTVARALPCDLFSITRSSAGRCLSPFLVPNERKERLYYDHNTHGLSGCNLGSQSSVRPIG